MAQIFEFKPKKAPIAQSAPSGAMYYCVRCNNDIFQLWANGLIQCSSCGSPMRNIYVENMK